MTNYTLVIKMSNYLIYVVKRTPFFRIIKVTQKIKICKHFKKPFLPPRLFLSQLEEEALSSSAIHLLLFCIDWIHTPLLPPPVVQKIPESNMTRLFIAQEARPCLNEDTAVRLSCIRVYNIFIL